jgi:hypothetical protein
MDEMVDGDFNLIPYQEENAVLQQFPCDFASKASILAGPR